MNSFDFGLLRSFVQTFSCPEPVVEIGSLLVDDSVKGFDAKNFFPHKVFSGQNMQTWLGGRYDRLDRID
jgi:hypothetical protein